MRLLGRCLGTGRCAPPSGGKSTALALQGWNGGQYGSLPAPFSLDEIPQHFITDKKREAMPTEGLRITKYECGPPWHRKRLELMLIDCTDVSKFDPGEVNTKQNAGNKVSLTWPHPKYSLPPSQGHQEWLLRIGVINFQACHDDCERSEDLVRAEMPSAIEVLLRGKTLSKRSGRELLAFKMWTDVREGRKTIRMLDADTFTAGAQFLVHMRAVNKGNETTKET